MVHKRKINARTQYSALAILYRRATGLKCALVNVPRVDIRDYTFVIYAFRNCISPFASPFVKFIASLVWRANGPFLLCPVQLFCLVLYLCDRRRAKPFLRCVLLASSLFSFRAQFSLSIAALAFSLFFSPYSIFLARGLSPFRQTSHRATSSGCTDCCVQEGRT